MPSITSDPEGLVRSCYAAAVAAVQPEAALHGPLRERAPDDLPCWIISVGKASHGMAHAIVEWLDEHGRTPDGGIVVAAQALAPPHAALIALTGDHPIPRARSARAAAAIADIVGRIPANAEVHVAISGGASALMAGPRSPLTMPDVTQLFELLISSGLDIRQMNAARKRATRWSAGRLALALAPCRLHLWVISDVIGDDLESIGSGPCTGDGWTSDEVLALLASRGLLDQLPEVVTEALRQETPKPDDPFLQSLVPRIVANNHSAVAAAAAAARRSGVEVQVMPDLLQGDAAEMGRSIAKAMTTNAAVPRVMIWGGETVVTIASDSGTGGRSQELALAAAERLQGRSGILLAAGTDGRDGPTDAAGALVDGNTWARVTASGRDAAADLGHHDSYPALNAAGALIKTGPSGTNVCDIAIAATGWERTGPAS
jgi:hydroxypyruvate reductase